MPRLRSSPLTERRLPLMNKKKTAVFDGLLGDNAAGADICMTNFAVAHLTVRQTYVKT